MSNEQLPLNTAVPDAIDLLLADAFDSALAQEAGANLAERVMTRIARQQRQRFIVLALVGLAAAIFSVFNLLPLLVGPSGLLGLLETVFSGGIGRPELGDWQSNLQGLALVLVMGIGLGWMMLEEALHSP